LGLIYKKIFLHFHYHEILAKLKNISQTRKYSARIKKSLSI
jgi:hypothetical protein